MNMMGNNSGVGGFFHIGGTNNGNRIGREHFNTRANLPGNSAGDTNNSDADFGDGGGFYSYGSNYNSNIGNAGFNSSAGRSHSNNNTNNYNNSSSNNNNNMPNSNNNSGTNSNQSHGTNNAFRMNNTTNQALSSQNTSLKATQQPSAAGTKPSAIVDLATNSAYIAVGGSGDNTGSDSDNNESPPSLPQFQSALSQQLQNSNKGDSTNFITVPAPAVLGKHPILPHQNQLQLQPQSHHHNDISLNDFVLQNHLQPASQPGSLNIHSTIMSGLSPPAHLMHPQYFSQQYSNHILAGTTISAASAAALSAPPATEPITKPKKAPPKRPAATKASKSDGADPPPPKKSNRGMLAISKPDPNSVSGMTWDNSLSAAEQLKLLKAEKIKNELNKKIAAIPDNNEFDASLG